MIQGGCPKRNGSGDPGYRFEDEINADDLGLNQMRIYDNEKGFNPMVDQRAFHYFILGPLYKKMGIKSQEELNKRIQEIVDVLNKMNMKEYYEALGYKYNPNLKSHKPVKGSLAMANSGPNTNGSQFFINVADTPWLMGKHTVFGKVVHGMDIVEKISLQEVGEQDRPKTEVTIFSIRVQK